jgi:hypothetical protein
MFVAVERLLGKYSLRRPIDVANRTWKGCYQCQLSV